MWRSEIAMQTSKPTLPQLATIVLFFLYVLIACPPQLRAQTQVDIERAFRSLTWSTESTGASALRRQRYSFTGDLDIVLMQPERAGHVYAPRSWRTVVAGYS